MQTRGGAGGANCGCLWIAVKHWQRHVFIFVTTRRVAGIIAPFSRHVIPHNNTFFLMCAKNYTSLCAAHFPSPFFFPANKRVRPLRNKTVLNTISRHEKTCAFGSLITRGLFFFLVSHRPRGGEGKTEGLSGSAREPSRGWRPHKQLPSRGYKM